MLVPPSLHSHQIVPFIFEKKLIPKCLQCPHDCRSSSLILCRWWHAVTSSPCPAFSTNARSKITGKTILQKPIPKSHSPEILTPQLCDGIQALQFLKIRVLRMVLPVVNNWSLSSTLLPGDAACFPSNFSILSIERYYSAAPLQSERFAFKSLAVALLLKFSEPQYPRQTNGER